MLLLNSTVLRVQWRIYEFRKMVRQPWGSGGGGGLRFITFYQKLLEIWKILIRQWGTMGGLFFLEIFRK